jgi:hypothetical protein
MDIGILNILKISLKNRVAKLEAEHVVLQGIKREYLENRSIKTMMASFPFIVLSRLVIRSMAM